MNYKKIYDKFLDYFKNTSPRQRLEKRNPKDGRLKEELYTELHHILPKSLGGSNDMKNLVRLLPEEHFFIHQLRFKVYKERCDFIAVKLIINGLKGKMDINTTQISKKMFNVYAWMKTNSSKFRKEVGWQSEEGRRRISEARKGTVVVKDIDGNIIGSVDKTHPKVLSGEWVHHSKGRTLSEKEREKRREPSTLSKNPRWLGISDNDLKDILEELSQILGFIPSWKALVEYSKNKKGIQIPLSLSKNRISKDELYRIVEEKTNLKKRTNIRKESELKKLKEIIYDKN